MLSWKYYDLKPAESTPISFRFAAELINDIFFPPGVINMLTVLVLNLEELW
jgi:acyl-CoA reductase-like NAD-dependent aldehyde dehydrogenase